MGLSSSADSCCCLSYFKVNLEKSYIPEGTDSFYSHPTLNFFIVMVSNKRNMHQSKRMGRLNN